MLQSAVHFTRIVLYTGCVVWTGLGHCSRSWGSSLFCRAFTVYTVILTRGVRCFCAFLALTFEPFEGFPALSSPCSSILFRQVNRPPDRSSNCSKSRSSIEVAAPPPRVTASIRKEGNRLLSARRYTPGSPRPHHCVLLFSRASNGDGGHRCTGLGLQDVRDRGGVDGGQESP